MSLNDANCLTNLASILPLQKSPYKFRESGDKIVISCGLPNPSMINLCCAHPIKLLTQYIVRLYMCYISPHSIHLINKGCYYSQEEDELSHYPLKLKISSLPAERRSKTQTEIFAIKSLSNILIKILLCTLVK